MCLLPERFPHLTLLHSERPKLYTILAFLSAIGLSLLVLLGCRIRIFLRRGFLYTAWCIVSSRNRTGVFPWDSSTKFSFASFLNRVHVENNFLLLRQIIFMTHCWKTHCWKIPRKETGSNLHLKNGEKNVVRFHLGKK